MAGGKSRCLRASNRRPLPIMSSLRAPDLGPLTFRSEISQGIARRRVGNLRVDQKEKSARLAKGRASRDTVSFLIDPPNRLYRVSDSRGRSAAPLTPDCPAMRRGRLGVGRIRQFRDHALEVRRGLRRFVELQPAARERAQQLAAIVAVEPGPVRLVACDDELEVGDRGCGQLVGKGFVVRPDEGARKSSTRPARGARPI